MAKRQTFYFLTVTLLTLVVSFASAEEGIRIPSYEKALRDVHVDATRFEELKVDPSKSGGSTLMGLIGRLMGGAPNSEFEGLGVNRYLYTAYKGDVLLGVSHGSSIEVDGKPIHIFVHYDSSTNLKAVEVKNAPSNVLATLKDGNYLKQLTGYATEDFQTTWEKKRRRLISHRGRAFNEMKYPHESNAKNYFEKIVRSLKYNVAFVDIAYFISRLPMMDLQSRRISSVAKGAGSPEAMVEGTMLSSPSGDRRKSFMINTPTAPQ